VQFGLAIARWRRWQARRTSPFRQHQRNVWIEAKGAGVVDQIAPSGHATAGPFPGDRTASRSQLPSTPMNDAAAGPPAPVRVSPFSSGFGPGGGARPANAVRRIGKSGASGQAGAPATPDPTAGWHRGSPRVRGTAWLQLGAEVCGAKSGSQGSVWLNLGTQRLLAR